MADKAGAIGKDLERVVVDATVQPRRLRIRRAGLTHCSIIKFVGLAKRNRLPLRQS